MGRRLAALLLLGAACGSRSSDAPRPATHAADAGTPGAHPLCVDGSSVDGGYPKTDYALGLLSTPPDMAFAAAQGPIALHDYFEPCAARSRLLVVRVGAPWCGTCRWHLQHTNDLKQLDIGSRLEWLDLMVANRDNDPPSVGELGSYLTLIDSPDKVAIDPTFQLGPVDPSRGALPFFVLMDTRSMTVRNFLHDPDPQTLETRIRQELAILDGVPLPPYPQSEMFDSIFFRNQWDMLHEMTLPGAPPPDPTNANADDARAAAFGKQLFSDATLSPSGTVSCASCHLPASQFQDGSPQPHGGVGPGDRNAPAIALAAHSRWQFWDGRADTLWMQALAPIENANELDSSRLFVAHRVVDQYESTYEAIFGPAPAVGDTVRFPPNGKPGDASWGGMAAADQKAVSDLFVNVAKSIAAFERTLRVKPNRLDAYVGGDLSALSDVEKKGLQTYFAVGCAQCHWGPRLTDDAFHPDRYPTGRHDGQADRGRIDGVAQLLASELAQPHSGLQSLPSQLGSFKTASLRGVAGSAPYGHGGTLATLTDVARNYGTAGLPATDSRAVGTTEPWLTQFAQSHADDLVPFLQTLTAEIAP